MTGNDYSQYQKSVISGYYDNIEVIMLQKLGELVTELYLAETPKRKDQLWKRTQQAMLKLKIRPAIIEHIMKKRSAEILAKNLQDWQNTKKKKK